MLERGGRREGEGERDALQNPFLIKHHLENRRIFNFLTEYPEGAEFLPSAYESS